MNIVWKLSLLALGISYSAGMVLADEKKPDREKSRPAASKEDAGKEGDRKPNSVRSEKGEQKSPQSEAISHFDRIDTNKDGVLSRKEFETAMKKVHQHLQNAGRGEGRRLPSAQHRPGPARQLHFRGHGPAHGRFAFRGGNHGPGRQFASFRGAAVRGRLAEGLRGQSSRGGEIHIHYHFHQAEAAGPRHLHNRHPLGHGPRMGLFSQVRPLAASRGGERGGNHVPLNFRGEGRGRPEAFRGRPFPPPHEAGRGPREHEAGPPHHRPEHAPPHPRGVRPGEDHGRNPGDAHRDGGRPPRESHGDHRPEGPRADERRREGPPPREKGDRPEPREGGPDRPAHDEARGPRPPVRPEGDRRGPPPEGFRPPRDFFNRFRDREGRPSPQERGPRPEGDRPAEGSTDARSDMTSSQTSDSVAEAEETRSEEALLSEGEAIRIPPSPELPQRLAS